MAKVVTTREFWPEYPGARPLPGEPDPAWYIELYWTEVAGVMECVGAQIRSVAFEDEPPRSILRRAGYSLDPKPLTTTLLRGLPLGRMIAGARDDQAADWRDHKRLLRERQRLQKRRQKGLRELSELLGAPLREGADRLDADPGSYRAEAGRWSGKRWTQAPEEIIAAADTYNTAVAEGRPPKKAVMEMFDGDKSKADRRIKFARERGLISKAKPGRRAGR
jgi:hypothetical protein